ncbi:MAG: radical SAM protein [Chloroflexota bacterium]
MADLTRSLLRTGTEIDNQDQSLDFLRRIGFLEPDPSPPPPVGKEFSPTTAVLLLTNQCQLRCTYCYAAAGESAWQELSFDLAKAAIDYVCENAQKTGKDNFELNFHGGGEPTLVWKTIEACVTYARQKPLPAEITLQSNGIWSAKKRAWLLNNLDSLSLSMDGSPETQNHQRPNISGRGSFNQVMQTIEELDRHKFSYGIRMTATAPWENFPMDVRFLCESTQCQSMQVEPAFNTQRGGHKSPGLDEVRGFAEAFVEASEIAARAGRSLVYSGARLGQVTSAFCRAPYDALIVTPHGTIVTCYEVTSDAHSLSCLSTIGRIDQGGIQMDAGARNFLHTKMAERRALCKSCFCYWSCAGDCYARTFKLGEEGHLQYGARCEANRFITEKLLLGAIAAGNGVWSAPNGRLALAAQ